MEPDVLKEELREAIERAKAAEAALAEERVSRKDAEEKLRTARLAALNELADEFRATISSVTQALGSAAEQLENSAHNLRGFVKSTSDEIASVKADVSDASRIASQVLDDAKSLHESVATVDIAWGFLARMGAEARESTVNSETTLAGLGENSEKVGKVVHEIRSIAEKTKILAINARIEASRSGVAGQGFTVVANEVGALASSVEQVTQEAAGMIATIRSDAGDTDKAVRNVTGVMQKLIDSAEAIGVEVTEQQSRAERIKESAGQGATALEKTTNRFAHVADAASNASDLSFEIEQASVHLNRIVHELEQSTETFMGHLHSRAV